MANFFQERLNPEWYHGHGKSAPFFEGWYYKLVNKAEDKVFAFIPGVFIHKETRETHAFIQVLDGIKGKATYHRFGVFSAKKDAFDVTIGGVHSTNYFNRDSFTLKVDDADGRLSGKVQFTNMSPFPVTLTSVGIMGWYGWLPFMECNHGVVSMDHEIHGKLNIYGDMVDFTGGRGYIEKDWGTNFPSGYVWMQSNHFEGVNASWMGSIAMIPNIGRTFAGFTCAFLLNEKIYRFATYNKTQVTKLSVDNQHVYWHMTNPDYTIEITAERAEGGLLAGPTRESMHMRVDETMKAKLHIKLFAVDGLRKRLIFEGTGRNAGLEVQGDISKLLR
jgi:tocopherol cyclase